ncbi:MAG: hypothetical protein M3495_13920 [Pseudomonadota bacterium]|nr:hypothetical protein [Pseudomonadota bacterium]
MSDPDKDKRECRFYLDDMIAFAQKVQTYTAGLDQAGFVDEVRLPRQEKWLHGIHCLPQASGHRPSFRNSARLSRMPPNCAEPDAQTAALRLPFARGLVRALADQILEGS